MKNMRKVVFLCQMNVVGTDAWEFWEVPIDTPETELETLGQELAEQNAETYGYSSYPNEDLAEGEYDEGYDDDIGACMYDYVPEKHDMYRVANDNSWNRY